MGDPSAFRRLYIMRHCERVDFAFGTSWIRTSFDKQGNYIRTNLNMPVTVPKRKGGPNDFLKDCPLTRIGLHQATLTGEAMKESGVKFSHVFCSPSLRCLETCTNALKASDQSHLPINVEPGLFEWLFWYRDSMPKWMTPEEDKEYGFNVNTDYQPIFKTTDFSDAEETSEEYYKRNFIVASKLLEKYSGNLLFVAHAASPDTCTRQLIGKSPRNEVEFSVLFPKVSYASVAVVEQKSDLTWNLVEPPFPSLLHTSNANFDWTVLLDKF